MTERRVATKEGAAEAALVALALAILFAVPHAIGGDGAARYETLERFVETGRLSSARYPVLGPLLASPLHVLGRAIGDPRGVTALFNPIVFAAGLALVYRELRDRTLVLLLVFASMFANHVQVFYGEVFTAIAITIGVLWLSRDRALAGWTAIVLGALNMPAALAGVGRLAIRDARRQRTWLPLLAPVAIVALGRLEALVLRGSLFATGYEGDAGFRTALPYSGKPGFSYPFVLGLFSIFLSFGKGLVFFAPGLFAPLARGAGDRLRWIHGSLVWVVAGLVLVYARWWAWYGGSFWGPRFFLLASVPACVSLATHLADPPRTAGMRVVLAAALILSFWVGVNGLVFDQNGLGLCSDNDWALEAFCWYVPEMSVLWHPLVDFSSAVPDETRALALAACALWTLACAYAGRRLFRQLGEDARGLSASWPSRTHP